MTHYSLQFTTKTAMDAQWAQLQTRQILQTESLTAPASRATRGASLSNVFKIKAKVIETSIKICMLYRHAQFECHSLTIVERITIEYYISIYKLKINQVLLLDAVIERV